MQFLSLAVIIASFIENYIFVSFTEIYHNPKTKWGKVIAIILLFILSNHLNTKANPAEILYFIIVVYAYSLICLEKGSYFSKLFYTICGFLIVSFSSLMVMSVLSFFLGSVHAVFNQESVLFIFSLFFSKLIAYLIYLFFKLNRTSEAAHKMQWRYFALTTLLVLILLLCVFSIFTTYQALYKICVLAFLCLFLLYILFYYYFFSITENNRKLMDKELEIKMLEANREFSQKIEEAYDNIRKLNHDLQYHFHTIYGKVEEQDLEGIRTYIENLDYGVTKVNIIRTTNKTLNNLLNYYLQVMEKKGIMFLHQVSHDVSFMNDRDLTTLMGNLLMNAIEAQEYVDEEKYISIVTKECMGMIIIQFENSCNMEKLIPHNDTFLTNKQDERIHGFGIKNVQRIVDQYHGDIVMECENQMFRTVITFYYIRNYTNKG